jgi:type VI secretion system protein ImpA
MLDLPDITPDSPAGPNLENDAAFGALERAAKGKPEQQAGAVIIPAEEPDWRDVEAQSLALLQTSHDLRILQILALARLHLRGLPGFAEVLATIRAQLESRWEHVHPQLDPEDDNDPTLRANALLSLADKARVLPFLRDLPLVSSARAGKISWRDIGISIGAVEPPDDRDKLTEATIRGAFADSDPARIATLREALTAAVAEAAAIPASFDSRSGFGSGPDLSELTKLLREMLRYLDRYAVVEEEAVEVATEQVEAGDAGGADAAVRPAPSGGRGASAASLGAVTNRADAMRLLDLVVGYYERYEPSSPLPLLIGRARRLADKNFLEILRDMAPDGVDSAQRITGMPDE